MPLSFERVLAELGETFSQPPLEPAAGTDSGVANAYVYTHSGPLVATLTNGTLIRFTPLNANTGPSTINVNSTGVVAIVGESNAALAGGELTTLGPVMLQYNGTAWQVISTTGARPAIGSAGAGTESGAANAYIYTHNAFSLAATLTAGTLIRFIPLNTNTGASTLNADGTGAVAIIRANGSALTGGELSSLGPVVLQSTGTQWQIVSTAGAQPGFERTAVESSTLLSGTISAITQAASAVITVTTVSGVNPFVVGQSISVSGVVGMTQINGLNGTVTATGGASGAWTVTVNINSSAFSAYVSGGTLALVVIPTNYSIPSHTQIGKVLPQRYGAKLDNATNDTVAWQSAIYVASQVGTGGVHGLGVNVLHTGGVSLASNLTLVQNVGIEGSGRDSCVLQALNSGSSDYFIGTTAYVNNVNGADAQCRLIRLTVNANNNKTKCVAWKSYYGNVEECRILGGNTYDVYLTTISIDGVTGIPSTMVNNRWFRNWFGDAPDYGLTNPSYNFYNNSPEQHSTDNIWGENYANGASVANVHTDTGAGWHIHDNHIYGATGSPPINLRVTHGVLGLVVADNIFENDVRIDTLVSSGFPNVVIGPGNDFFGNLWTSPNAGQSTISLGNHYFSTGQIRPSVNTATAITYSVNDTFDNATPVAFYAAIGGATAPNSVAGFIADNCTLSNGTIWTGSFSGNSSGNPIQFFSRGSGSLAAPAPGPVYTGSPGYSFVTVASGSLASGTLGAPTVLVPWNDAGGILYAIEVQFSFELGINFAGNTIQYFGQATIIRSGANTFHYVMNNIIYTPAQWTTPPALTITESGGIVTIVVTGTFPLVNTNSYQGNAMVKAFV